eukprot:RCo039796
MPKPVVKSTVKRVVTREQAAQEAAAIRRPPLKKAKTVGISESPATVLQPEAANDATALSDPAFRTIKVAQVAPLTTAQTIISFFSTFGDVEQAEYLPQEHVPWRVTFSKPEPAQQLGRRQAMSMAGQSIVVHSLKSLGSARVRLLASSAAP